MSLLHDDCLNDTIGNFLSCMYMSERHHFLRSHQIAKCLPKKSTVKKNEVIHKKLCGARGHKKGLRGQITQSKRLSLKHIT